MVSKKKKQQTNKYYNVQKCTLIPWINSHNFLQIMFTCIYIFYYREPQLLLARLPTAMQNILFLSSILLGRKPITSGDTI